MEWALIVSIPIFISMRYYIIISVVILLGCKNVQSERMFSKIDSEKSGIFFENTIRESDSLNIMDYDYLYNGGGVGIGDFNSDGKPDIFFTGNMTSSRLYLNEGDLKFKDITETAGVTTNTWCTGVSIVDINSDGKPDIHVATGMDTDQKFHPNYFFINMTESDGAVKFKNQTFEMGLRDSLYSVQAAWLDYDKDNDLDLFLINNALQDTPKNIPLGQRKDGKGKSTDKLYRNEGNKNGIPQFVDVSEEAGILTEGWSLGVTISDFNNDFYPDIYVANDFLSNDLLYINQQDGTFKNEVSRYMRHQSHNSMGIDIADINNDSEPDVMVLDMLPEDNLRQKTMFPDIGFENYQRILDKGYQPQYVRNVLQLSNGNQTFSELGNYSGISATDWSWSPLLADYDNDGLRDLYITNGYVKEITDLDFADTNNKGSSFGTSAAKRKKLVDQLNAMKGVKKSNVFYRNAGKAQFENTTKDIGLEIPSFSNGAAYADLDADGDMDIVVNNINDPAFLFENKSRQKDTLSTSYLQLRMPEDALSLGSKIYVYHGKEEFFAEHYPQRGYLSTMENTVHFGLGEAENIDSLKVLWPNGNKTVLENVATNQVMKFTKTHFENAKGDETFFTEPVKLVQVDSTSIQSTFFGEKRFKGFNRWSLHFREYDKLGPDVAIADINGDGLEDICFTGSAGISTTIFFQQVSGEFVTGTDDKEVAKQHETNKITLFDADNDGDLDLYCANGSSEHFAQKELWQDLLYLNDGSGKLDQSINALPKMETITTTVTPLDYDKDGDMDLFIGGRVLPEEYPKAPRSYLLQNNKGQFEDVTNVAAFELLHPGMVTDAIAEDIDKDGWLDITLVGEYMPIQIYYNRKGKFKLDQSNNGLQNSNGWWNCVKAADFDGDGDIDFVAGNWGLNNFFKVTEEEPISIYSDDYDSNGTMEPIVAFYNEGKEYIAHPRNTLLKLIPGLRNRVIDYAAYGTKSIDEIFGRKALDNAYTVKAYELASTYVENLGKGEFSLTHLPMEAQWSPVFDIVVNDVDEDGFLDLLGVGNYSGTEVLTGNYDAGNGILLLGDGNGSFRALSANESGFFASQESRGIATIVRNNNGRKQEVFITANQNAPVKLYRKR